MYIRCLIALGLISALALPQKSYSLEYTPLSDHFVSDLQSKFKATHQPDQKILEKKQSWDCTLYGMRSRKQSHVETEFYRFHRLDPSVNIVQNSGGQQIRNYFAKPVGMIGREGALVDQVRMTPEGNLMGEMTIPHRERSNAGASDATERVASVFNEKRTVIAYTVCN